MAKIIHGPSITIGDETFALPEILEEIKDSMAEESEPEEDLNEDLILFYLQANVEERDIIDETLKMVCGFGLPTLLKNAVAEDALLKVLDIETDQDEEDGNESVSHSG